MIIFDMFLNFKEYFEKFIRFFLKMVVKDYNIFFNWDCLILDIFFKISICYIE